MDSSRPPNESDADYWERIGQENPYWGVLSHEKFLGRDIDNQYKEEFMAEGERDIGFVLGLIEKHVKRDFAPRAALDFGCGVGRLVIPMARHAQMVTGIDVSRSMLLHATRNARELGPARVRFSSSIPPEDFDWINSYIVFQHIEPRKGIALLNALMSRLAPGGILSLHFSIFRDQRIAAAAVQESLFGRYDGTHYVNFRQGDPKGMPIYEYDLSEVVCCLTKHNAHTLTMRHLDHSGLHGVWIVGMKDVS